jgi:hypothetical protein
MQELSRGQVEKLIDDYQAHPFFAGQNPLT